MDAQQHYNTDARGFQGGDALDLWVGDRLGNAALIGIQLDRPRLGGDACGQADVFLDPAREAASPASFSHSELVIDYAGVGRPVFDLFCGRGVSPIGVTITGGDGVSNERPVWRVAKLILISRVQGLTAQRTTKNS